VNILIINHSIENCGVYQYGKRFSNILQKSKKYNFIYCEHNSQEELESSISKWNPKFIIYNYLGGTLPWVNPTTVQSIRNQGIKQFTIVHNSQFNFFDYYLHQNPDHPNVDNYNFSLKRPLFEYVPKTNVKRSPYLEIGTFGFGLSCKQVDNICRLVNDQFDIPVKLNFHLTVAHFGGNTDVLNEIKLNCEKVITKSNIILNITSHFLTNEEMLDFLYFNDLNIFFYEKYNFYNGISSSVDYALSVKKPIAVCRSNMFSHIYDVTPSICVEDNNLHTILNNGFKVLESKYQDWSHDNFISHFENILEKINNV
jgi:hypothetical protein